MSPFPPARPERRAALRWCEIGHEIGCEIETPRAPRPAHAVPPARDDRHVPGPIDLLGLFEGLRVEACPWLLDSALPSPRLGRFSYAGADPLLVARVRGDRLEVHSRRPAFPDLPPGFHVFEGDPLDSIRGLIAPVALGGEGGAGGVAPPLPFTGGVVGHLGYELGAFSTPVALHSREGPGREVPGREGLGFPDATLLFADRLLAVDHVDGRSFALGWGFGATSAEAAERAEAALEVVRGWADRGGPARRPGPRRLPPDLARRRDTLARTLPPSAACSLDGDAYEAGVRSLVREIEAGNVYEVNLTRRISLACDADPFALYRALRRESPAPFACFFELPEGAILSSSPERFLRLDRDGSVESRPIKGTRPRGATPERDAALAAELEASEKDRAENLMIVDLVRNDLGRVCEPGSIRVPELMVVEAYATVFQLVSTITGRLRRDCDAIDLVRAAFPPGSMTGAPKIAAMRMIDRIEPVRRGVYAGAVGWFDLRGGFDLSVVIRTLLLEKGRAHLHVGGAIVADSRPADERDESIDKARALLAAWAAVTEH